MVETPLAKLHIEVEGSGPVVLFLLDGGDAALAVVGRPWRAHRNRSAMCMPSTPSAGIITASQTAATPHSIRR